MFLLSLLMIVGFMLIIIGFIGMVYGSSINGFFNATFGAIIVMMLSYFMRVAL